MFKPLKRNTFILGVSAIPQEQNKIIPICRQHIQLHYIAAFIIWVVLTIHRKIFYELKKSTENYVNMITPSNKQLSDFNLFALSLRA